MGTRDRTAYLAAYYQAHKEKIKAYRDSRKAEAAAYNKAYQEAHRAELKAYRAAHREEWRRDYAKWLAENRNRKRELNHEYRARRDAQFVEPVSVDAIYERDGGICHICRKPVPIQDVSIDHLTPLSRGGVHAPWNVRIAHYRCNVLRSNRGPAQLLLLRE